MVKKETAPPSVSSFDQSLVLSSLEHDQLVGAKKHHIPRPHLKGPELLVLWALRLYFILNHGRRRIPSLDRRPLGP